MSLNRSGAELCACPDDAQPGGLNEKLVLLSI